MESYVFTHPYINLLVMRKILFTLPTLLLLLVYGFTLENSRTITGLVTDAKDGSASPGVSIRLKGTKAYSVTNANGLYTINVPSGKGTLIFTYVGYQTKEVKIGKSDKINVSLEPNKQSLSEEVVVGYGDQNADEYAPVYNTRAQKLQGRVMGIVANNGNDKESNTESYTGIEDNRFLTAIINPLSTFSIDVDAASYSNIRRYVTDKQLPPIDAVRIEEMVNYFNYDYPQPIGEDPVSINTEVASAPWNPEHRFVKIGLKGKSISTENLPASNLVFLVDVSGSMDAENKLPLLISSFKLLVDQLREKDKVAIVVYAGSSGLVLPSTSGDNKQKIKEALNKLQAGGSTAGGEGIKLAYKVAEENFVKGGNNRVILATDGDFNVGDSSDAEMQRLIEEKRQSGVFLTALGFGMGNYKDSKMETLADKGNGNYAYIDNLNEAKKVLVNEFGGTLFTIAKDVKLQIEFNPAKVQAYRLIGYENRMLNKEDFNNDKKDAGELGSGQTVTALYEIISVGVKNKFIGKVDELKYQKMPKQEYLSDELLTVKLRYKKPDQDESKLLLKAVTDTKTNWEKASDNFRFAASVAGYGMLLRNSEFKQSTTYRDLVKWTEGSIGDDKLGYRKEFLKIVKYSQQLAEDLLTANDDEN